MRSILFEFYKPNEEELKEAWNEGIFSFDANVLLNLYRYSTKTTTELLGILKHLEPQLWLTHQAGFEYLNNRLHVISQQKVAYGEIKSILNKKYEELCSELNSYKKHSTIEVDRDVRIKDQQQLNESLKAYKDIQEYLATHADAYKAWNLDTKEILKNAVGKESLWSTYLKDYFIENEHWSKKIQLELFKRLLDATTKYSPENSSDDDSTDGNSPKE